METCETHEPVSSFNIPVSTVTERGKLCALILWTELFPSASSFYATVRHLTPNNAGAGHRGRKCFIKCGTVPLNAREHEYCLFIFEMT